VAKPSSEVEEMRSPSFDGDGDGLPQQKQGAGPAGHADQITRFASHAAPRDPGGDRLVSNGLKEELGAVSGGCRQKLELCIQGRK